MERMTFGPLSKGGGVSSNSVTCRRHLALSLPSPTEGQTPSTDLANHEYQQPTECDARKQETMTRLITPPVSTPVVGERRSLFHGFEARRGHDIQVPGYVADEEMSDEAGR